MRGVFTWPKSAATPNMSRCQPGRCGVRMLRGCPGAMDGSAISWVDRMWMLGPSSSATTGSTRGLAITGRNASGFSARTPRNPSLLSAPRSRPLVMVERSRVPATDRKRLRCSGLITSGIVT